MCVCACVQKLGGRKSHYLRLRLTPLPSHRLTPVLNLSHYQVTLTADADTYTQSGPALCACVRACVCVCLSVYLSYLCAALYSDASSSGPSPNPYFK